MSIPEPGRPARQEIVNIRLAHISDPHLTSLDDVGWRELLNKRMLGWLSWKLKRRHVHQPAILDALQQDLQQSRPDHIAVTGDLTQLGTISECRQAYSWLEQLGTAEKVTVIPGNHDRYAPAAWDKTVGQWTEYMRSDKQENNTDASSLFPALRIRDRLALIGLSTARPTAPFLASGRLGRQQLQRLGEVLERTGRQGYFRAVLLHHGPITGTYSRRRSLADGDQFCRIIEQQGAEVILHGHGHRPLLKSLRGADIPVFGAASASYRSPDPEKRAAYNIYDITATGSGWQLIMTPRSFDADNGIFTAGRSRRFMMPCTSRTTT